MPRKQLYPSRPIRVRAAIYVLIILAAVISLSPAFTRLTVLAQGDGAPADTGDVQPRAEFIRRLSLRTNDVVYNPADQMLYASVPSSAGAAGNSIIPINPATGETGTPVFVGSEPNKLAMSDDGRTLYVALDGSFSIRRFDTTTRTAGQQFSLNDPSSRNYIVQDLAVAPGNSNVVAVARFYINTSPPEAGIAVFDNGVQRPKTGPDHLDGGRSLAFSATESKLYGTGHFLGLRTMTVDASGVTVRGHTSFSVRGNIKFVNGRVYSSDGQVVNPDTSTLLGTFSGAAANTFTVDVAAGRAYYLASENSFSSTVTLKAFDLNTFALVGSATLSNLSGAPVALTRWSANGLAFRTNADIYLVQTSLIPSSDPIPTPTPIISPTPTPTPATIPVVINKINLPANDLVINAATQTLYASVAGSAGGTTGNSITSIDPKTGAIGASTFIGSEPGKLAISDDGQVLYVYLRGASAIRRFDIATKTPGVQFPIGTDKVTGMEVVPGSQQSLAVARERLFVPGSVAIYDNGVQRPNTSGGGFSIGPIGFGATPATLYDLNFSNFSATPELVKFELDASGIKPIGLMRHTLLGGAGFKFAGGKVYSASGIVVDPEENVHVGRFDRTGAPFGDAAVLVDPTLGRVFFLSSASFTDRGAILSAYDLNTFLPLGSVMLPSVFGTPAGLVRWGTKGLAFCMQSNFRTPGEPNRIYLVESELISDGKPLPSTLQFTAPNYNISESSSPNALIAVTRRDDVTGAAMVNYATGGGTATPDSDYTPISGTLFFAEGETTKTFTVPILDDHVYEGATRETIGLTLSGQSGDVVLGSQKTATLTIKDSKGRPSIISESMSVPEGDSGTTNAQVVVRLSHPSVEIISVNYATADDTANVNSDYVAASGTLTFQPGELEKTLALQIKGDTAAERDERFSINFSNPVNVTLNNENKFITIIDDDHSFIQFAAAEFAAGEGDGRALITVTRSGALTAKASIGYLTLDDSRAIRCDDSTASGGAAFARCDYMTTFDTLVFAPGESRKTFAVPLVDDGHDEPRESIQLRLVTPAGATLGSPSSSVLAITDNDEANQPNPVDAHEFFVRQHYLDFLSREPEAGEPWSAILNGCPNVNGDPACDRITVSQSFFGAPEFRLKGLFVYNFYRVAFNRRPEYAEIIPDMRSVTGQTPADTFARRAAFPVSFVQRPEFKTAYDTLSNTAYVNALLDRYQLAQITTPDPQQPEGGTKVTLTRAELIDRLGAAAGSAQALTRAQVLRAVVESDEVGAIEYKGAFVAMQYYGYLRRTPEESGYQAWLKVITEDPNNIRIMINGFMNSTEYKLRFGRL